MRRPSILLFTTIATWYTLCHGKPSSLPSSSTTPSSIASRTSVRNSKSKRRRRSIATSPVTSSSSSSPNRSRQQSTTGAALSSSSPASAIDEELFDIDNVVDDDFDLESIAANLDDIDFGVDSSSSSSSSSSINNNNSGSTPSSFMGGDQQQQDEFDFDSDSLLDGDEDGMSPTQLRDDGDDDEEYGQGSEKGALYDAYNLLHTLAQDFEKPFDAPAVVVVGHQSSGKSALIEALMGFQFNQVGGGTKTRRPIALRMQYNPHCSHPKCFLQDDDGVERPKTLSEIQRYVEQENKRLERDPVRCFDAREINIRMEYKYCPNMILIDTPGLIAAPKIPRGRMNSGAVSMQQRALLKSAREAERLVVNKMKCPDYIILCVEDTMDWKHGATREIVQKADPDLSRTVICNTKLDTKLPQFGTPSDVCDFLKASVIDSLSPHKLGGPFFSSVPSGRVGRSGDNEEFDDFLFEHDEEFVDACYENEKNDRINVSQKLKSTSLKRGKNAKASVSATKALLPRVGLSRLRGFLERRVDECYRRNVAKIVPMLQAEHEACKRRLESCERELDAISIERLKQGADAFCDEFCAALKETIQGSIVAPPSLFGETLEQENAAAGTFHDVQGCPMAITERVWDRLLDAEVGNKVHRLYGGAQYHRTMREFNLATRCLRLPNISEDEIANAAGIGDTHDGVNFLRAACIISLEKARMSFDPLLHALRIRMVHVMGKACPISEYMLVQKKERNANSYGYGNTGPFGMPGSRENGKADITQNPQFRQLVRTIYDKFVNQCSESTMMRCYDDLTSLTRFVTWDMHERSSGALKRALPDQTDIVNIYQVAVKAAEEERKQPEEQQSETTVLKRKNELANSDNIGRDYANLLQLMEEAACSRNAGRTNMVVGGLVQHIVSSWRETFARSVTQKFNCYFLLPFVDEFHKYLRLELQKVYDGQGETLNDVFDLISARKSLQQQRQDLIAECKANSQLQERFEMVSRMMREEQERSTDDTFSSGPQMNRSRKTSP